MTKRHHQASQQDNKRLGFSIQGRAKRCEETDVRASESCISRCWQHCNRGPQFVSFCTGVSLQAASRTLKSLPSSTEAPHTTVDITQTGCLHICHAIRVSCFCSGMTFEPTTLKRQKRQAPSGRPNDSGALFSLFTCSGHIATRNRIPPARRETLCKMGPKSPGLKRSSIGLFIPLARYWIDNMLDVAIPP